MPATGAQTDEIYLCNFCARRRKALSFRLPGKIISTTSHKDVMDSSKCPLKYEKLLRLRDEGCYSTIRYKMLEKLQASNNLRRL